MKSSGGEGSQNLVKFVDSCGWFEGWGGCINVKL